MNYVGMLFDFSVLKSRRRMRVYWRARAIGGRPLVLWCMHYISIDDQELIRRSIDIKSSNVTSKIVETRLIIACE